MRPPSSAIVFPSSTRVGPVVVPWPHHGRRPSLPIPKRWSSCLPSRFVELWKGIQQSLFLFSVLDHVSGTHARFNSCGLVQRVANEHPKGITLSAILNKVGEQSHHDKMALGRLLTPLIQTHMESTDGGETFCWCVR